MFEEDTKRDLDEIKSRAKEIGNKYLRGDKIVLPPREIKDISFHPLKINFRKIFYFENPLLLYLESIKIYNGLSRTQLFEFDEAIYRALSRSDQLEIAIPELNHKNSGRKPLPEKEVSKIFEALKQSGGILCIAARISGYSIPTVRKYRYF